jgi:hypothetical protein
MTTVEDLVRQAQDRMADRAAPPSRIRAALPVRAARVRRQQRLTAGAGVLAAAAVAAAITVPALAVRPARAPAVVAPAGPTTAPVSSAAIAPPAEKFGLGYRLTWAPPGFTERIRSAGPAPAGDEFGPTVIRTWKKRVGPGDPAGGAELTLYVRTAVPDVGQAMDTTGRKVDINGVRGYYQPSDGSHKSSLNFSPAPHTALILAAGHLDLSEADMLRAARSIRADAGTAASPLRLRWLPDGWSATGFTVSGPSRATWRGEVDAAPGPSVATTGPKALKSAPGSLSVVVGTTTDAPAGGAKLTVGGHPARHPIRTDAAGQSLTYLNVDLGHGRLMTLIGDGGITLDEMSRVAINAQISAGGLDWLG